jgi:hypothetical protein
LIKIPRSRKSSKPGRTRRKSRKPAAPAGPKPGTHHFSAVALAVAAPEIGARRLRVFKEVTNKPPLKRAPYRQEQLKAAVLNQYPQWSEHYPTKDELPTPSFLSKLRQAVLLDPVTKHLLRDKYDRRLDKSLKRLTGRESYKPQ